MTGKLKYEQRILRNCDLIIGNEWKTFYILFVGNSSQADNFLKRFT